MEKTVTKAKLVHESVYFLGNKNGHLKTAKKRKGRKMQTSLQKLQARMMLVERAARAEKKSAKAAVSAKAKKK